MAKHLGDLMLCRKLPGSSTGLICEKHEGLCVICDSFVNSQTVVRVCDECSFGKQGEKCIICNGVGVSEAMYCKECTTQEKHLDGCPRIKNISMSKTDLYYEKKKVGVKIM